MYTMNAWIGLAFVFWLINTIKKVENVYFTTIAFIVLFFVLRNIVLNFRSPSPDLIVTVISIYVIINLCLEFLNNKYKNGYEIFNWLLLLSIYAITVKISASFGILPLVICYAYYLKKYTVQIFKFISIVCIFLVLPWLVRSVLLSGFIIYPYLKFPINLPFTINEYYVKHENLPKLFQFWTSVEMEATVARPSVWYLFKDWFTKQWVLPFNLATLLFTFTVVVTPLIILFTYIKKLVSNYLLLLYLASYVSIALWLLGNCDYRFGTHLLLIVIYISFLPFYQIKNGYMPKLNKKMIKAGLFFCMAYYFYYDYKQFKTNAKHDWFSNTYKTIYHQKLPLINTKGTIVLKDEKGITVEIVPKGFDQIQVPIIFSIEQKKRLKLKLLGKNITDGIGVE